jgi:hypothetical protein
MRHVSGEVHRVKVASPWLCMYFRNDGWSYLASARAVCFQPGVSSTARSVVIFPRAEQPLSRVTSAAANPIATLRKRVESGR